MPNDSASAGSRQQLANGIVSRGTIAADPS